MAKLIFATVFFFSLSALANVNSYDLSMMLSMNGKHISSPRLIAKAGETATIIQKTGTEGSFIEVVANEGEVHGQKGIMMNFVIGVIGQDGERTIIATPQILATEDEEALVSVGQDGENGEVETLNLSVTARRKAL